MTDLQRDKLKYTLKFALKKLDALNRRIIIYGGNGYIANDSQFIDTGDEMKEIDSALKLLDRLDSDAGKSVEE